MLKFDKKLISIRYWLIGKQYHLALKALEYGLSFHKGTRKTGDPEFYHQLSIIHYLKTLIDELDYPEETLVTACLHDCPEDYDVGFEEIESLFGKEIRLAVELLTKKHRGDKVPPLTYYNQISNNPIASVVKGADRIDNISTINEVFTLEKQKEYLSETHDFVLPMLKSSRRKYTKQEPVYENIKLVLNSQMNLIRAVHKGSL